MKQCPTCKGIFNDDTLRYCLSDGSLLTSPYDPEATHFYSPPQPTNLPPASVVPDPPAPVQPARQGVNPLIVYVLIAVLALVVGAGVMALLRPEVATQTPSPVSTPTPKQETAKAVNDEVAPKKETKREALSLSSPAPAPVVVPQQVATPQPRFVPDSESDPAYKSCFELQVMRNEIFARHGYIFKKNKEMREYFLRQSWYRPMYDDVSSMLSNAEVRRAQLIKQYERRKGCPQIF